MNIKNTQPVAQAAKLSWARAKNLAHNTNTTPGQARSYLAQNPHHATEFDRPIDKRNPITRSIIQTYLNSLQTNQNNTLTNRPSYGDPTRTPRAGAPTKTTELQQTLAQSLTPQILNAQPQNIDTNILYELKTLAQKTKGIPNLAYALALLNHIQTNP